MKERPILFSAPMVRAILEGHKTQTRRVVKPQPIGEHGCWMWAKGKHRRFGVIGVPVPPEVLTLCPYGQPGDRLWVREATEEDSIGSASFARYRADGFTSRLAWWYSRKSCPSIHMPRWASRITLEIVAVRVERLNDISEADAEAEGTPCYVCGGALDGRSEEDCHCFHRKATASDYRNLWEQINGAGSWAANPWVWVVEFKRVQQ